MDRSIALLERLTQADAVPGFEDEVRELFRAELAGVGEMTADRTGSVICNKPGLADRPRIMLDCHLDETGFIIQHVTPQGFLKFLPLGGWWTHNLPAQRVRVHGSGRPVFGVIGSTPPHFLPKERRSQVMEVKDLFIDIGCSSREQVEALGIRVGSWAVPWSPFTRLADERLLLAKAFDNRAGCALCIETLREIGDHPNALYASGSAQEEVGLRGTRTAAAVIDPDVAIVLEGPPADDTPGFNPDESQGALGRGVQIRAYDPSMVANPRFVELALETAASRDIPHQITVRASGGTNAGQIHLHERGVPTIVLGVPARYIHAHTSVIHVEDYRAARALAIALIEHLDEKTVAALHS
jgi:endoglucanase